MNNNDDNHSSVNEILIITDRTLSALLATVRTFLAPLYAAADAVTLLDVLMAFAMRAVHDKRYGSARRTTRDAARQRLCACSATVFWRRIGAHCAEAGAPPRV